MAERLDFRQASPEAYKAMRALESHIEHCGLERSLLELVKVRVSQINGCAFCIDMHTKEARVEGESEQRLYALAAWRETPFFVERERAALTWAEALTRLGEDGVSDDVYQIARSAFSDQELADLTYAIVAINGWNRLAIGFRTEPGLYQPKRRDKG